MGKFVDLTGMNYGRLTVVRRAIEFENERAKLGKRKDTYWICECECGSKNIKPKRGTDLKSGKISSCGCVRNDRIRKYISEVASNNNSIFDYIKENNLENIVDWDKNKLYGLNLKCITKKSKIKIWVRCKNCSDHPSYDVTCKNFSNGSGCPYCNGTKVCRATSVGELYPEIFKIWSDKNKKTPYEYTSGSSKFKVIFKCCDCGEEYSKRLCDSINSYFKCPKCNNRSIGEQKIYEFLNSVKIETLEQYKFKDCIYKKALPFDFYLPNINTCIEFDGEQHYAPVRFNGMDKRRADLNFKKQKIRDAIKNKYCEDNNIRLIRIPYWEIDNICQLLTNELKLRTQTT